MPIGTPLDLEAGVVMGARYARILGGRPCAHPVTVAREIGSDGVFFAGWRGHDDLPGALAACDALVMPSVNDSYPQTPLEAMAVGLPVIATSSGGFPFVVNLDPARPTGWLVPPDDELALSETLVDAVNRPQEIARRGDAALAHARAHLSSRPTRAPGIGGRDVASA